MGFDLIKVGKKFLDETGSALAGALGEGVKMYKGINNIDKPLAYQTISNLVTDIETILLKDSNPLEVEKKCLPDEVTRIAGALCEELRKNMAEFDKDTKRFKKEDHPIILDQFITNCYNTLYKVAPVLTTEPTLWNKIAATLNEFTQWLGQFDLIDEKRISRNAFFKPHAATRDVLVEEQAKINPQA